MGSEGSTATAFAFEIAEKQERLGRFLRDQQLDAIVLSRHENIAWMTAGRVDIRVGVLRETGPASLLITKDGEQFYLTTENEAARLAEEEFAGLAYKPLLRPWTSADVESSICSAVPSGRIGTDAPLGSHPVVNVQPLRLLLTSGEQERYRLLGKEVASIATAVLLQIEPGMTERRIQALMAEKLLDASILPSVHLQAVDRRVLSYPHPVPRAGVLQRLAMLCFCARRGGLTTSITRFVHFGRLPAELADNFAIVQGVNARVQAATREGSDADTLFSVLRKAYAELGAPGGEMRHHQGGAAGYMEREWLARPGGGERISAAQALAWNPSFHGAKVEDTVLLTGGVLQRVTATPDLPEVTTTYAGHDFVSAGVLIH